MACTLALQPCTAHAWENPAHHELSVSLNEQHRTAKISDTITLHPDEKTGDVITLVVHGDYRVTSFGLLEGSIGNFKIAQQPEEHSGTSRRQIVFHKPGGQNWSQRLKLKLE